MKLLSGLFLETRPATQSFEPVYTLKDWDHTRPNGVTLQSLYLLYMAENDPTEYTFATKHLDGWEHWQALCRSNFFIPYITRWREELKLRVKAESLKRLLEVAQNPEHKSYTEVNKFLVQHGYLDRAEKGRPSKAQVKKAAQEQAEEVFNLSEDYSRIFGAQISKGSN